MIQAEELTEGDYRGERFADWSSDLRGNNDLLSLTRPRPDPGHPREVPRRGLRHRRDQHLQRQLRVDGGLRHAGPGAGTERRLGPARARGRRRGVDPRSSALRRRRSRPHQPHRLDVAGRLGPRLPEHRLRRARRVLLRRRRRARRGRRRRDPDRDRLRHAEREGRDLRVRAGVRGARAAAARHDLRHDHRRVGAHAVGPDARRVLALGASREADQHRSELRARPRAAARPRRGALRHRRHGRLGAPERGPAERVRRLRRGARRDGGGHRRVGRERLAQHRRRVLRHDAPTTSPRSRARSRGTRRARSRP